MVTVDSPFHEAGLLKLNCDKALLELKWQPNLDYRETIEMVGDWYASFYQKQGDMYALTQDQIAAYESLGEERKRVWARSNN